MSRNSKRRRLSVSAVLVALLICVLAPSMTKNRASAMSLRGTFISFYCDETRQNYCGYEWHKCNGQVEASGCNTAFSTTASVLCTILPEPPPDCGTDDVE